jgi:peroxiredoxin
MNDWPSPIQPGEPAPEFTLPAVNRGGVVRLDEFRGRHALLIGFFRGLHCPFCRRQIVRLAASQPALAQAGVATLAVINTPADRARLYFEHRPTPVTLLSDPECSTHRAFGVPRIGFLAADSAEPPQWPYRARMEQFMDARIDPTGELNPPEPPMAANGILNRKDGFELTAVDEEILANHGTQLAGHVLIDLQGIVRWTHFEGLNGPEDIGRFPSPDDLLLAARGLRPLRSERPTYSRPAL